MPDLVVTSIAVDEAAEQLKAIFDEFTNANKSRDDQKDIWGHETVESAMYDFVEDWWVKREKLTVNLKDLQAKMQQASETWGETEIQLADVITPADT
ncbi:hypothetical protein [Cryobacterium sp. SO1]|uniref:hypothetical protein n=1 Tax=Cryobacterium sp. SO1 TaxID=1897061 RepID=UPI001023687E|nr:hypothetical protein [Cryobacterium sp. SO1]RZI34288.1 hypothetical protein BJQ95_03429 [Cryobacterium sp. SO1]